MTQYLSIAVSAAAVVGLMSTATAEEVRMRIASSYPTGVIQMGTQLKRLEDNLNTASGGDLQVKIFEPGALVPALEVFDAVSNGSVDAAWSAPGNWQSKEPALALFSAIPFGPSAPEYLGWLLAGGGQEMMQEIYAKYNIQGMLCGILAPEASGWFREEITSIDQLDGLKMRFFGLGAKVMQEFGVDTQLLAGGDVYPALERGTIDAVEFSSPALDLDLGFYQIADHYYFPGWHQQTAMLDLMINKDKWDSMSEAQQRLISMACEANIAFGIAEGEAAQSAALAELREKGVNIHTWPPEFLAQLEEAWNEIAAEEAAADPTFQKAWEELQAYRADHDVWKELGYLRN